MRRVVVGLVLLVGCAAGPHDDRAADAKLLRDYETSRTRHLLNVVLNDTDAILVQCALSAPDGAFVDERNGEPSIEVVLSFDEQCRVRTATGRTKAGSATARCIEDAVRTKVRVPKELCPHPAFFVEIATSLASTPPGRAAERSRSARLSLLRAVDKMCGEWATAIPVIYSAKVFAARPRDVAAERTKDGPVVSPEAERCMRRAVQSVDLTPYLHPEWPLELELPFFARELLE